MTEPQQPKMWDLLEEAAVDRNTAQTMLQAGVIAIALELEVVTRDDGTREVVVRPRRRRI